MKKIAVISSGIAPASVRVASLFNAGNRIHVVAVVTDRENPPCSGPFAAEGVETYFFPSAEWEGEGENIASLLDSKGIDLLAVEEFDRQLPPGVVEKYSERSVVLSSPEDAPRMVVQALDGVGRGESEVESRGMDVDVRELEVGNPESGVGSPESEVGRGKIKSVDEEWAEVLQMKFDPKVVGQTPPPLPGTFTVPPVPSVAPSSPRQFAKSTSATPETNKTAEKENDRPMPPAYLVWSVLCAVFCCTLPGIVAIVFSSQVSQRWSAGDTDGAERASHNAEIWIIVSFVLGVVSATLWIPTMLIG